MKNIPQYLQNLIRQKMDAKVRSFLDPALVQKWAADAFNRMVLEALNAQMVKERDEFLGRQPYQRDPDALYRNGFKPVSTPFLGGLLDLRKPVLRCGGFTSPTWKAVRKAGRALLGFLAGRLWLRGLGTRQAAQEINDTFGTRLSPNAITRITRDLAPVIREWEKRLLPSNLRYLYLDALYVSLRGPEHFEKSALLVAIGVDEAMKRHFLGFLLVGRESRETWSALIRDLLDRGLSASSLRLVISDAHEGIREAVKDLLRIPHQLCVVHKQRNACARVSHANQKAFKADFKRVFWAESRSQALVALGQLKSRWQGVHPKAVETVERDLEDYLRFFEEDRKYWTITRSSNLIERFMEELRRRLKPARGMQNEFELDKLVYGVATAQQERWNRLKVHTSRKEDKAQAA
jgi:transposase-like protein